MIFEQKKPDGTGGKKRIQFGKRKTTPERKSPESVDELTKKYKDHPDPEIRAKASKIAKAKSSSEDRLARRLASIAGTVGKEKSKKSPKKVAAAAVKEKAKALPSPNATPSEPSVPNNRARDLNFLRSVHTTGNDLDHLSKPYDKYSHFENMPVIQRYRHIQPMVDSIHSSNDEHMFARASQSPHPEIAKAVASRTQNRMTLGDLLNHPHPDVAGEAADRMRRLGPIPEKMASSFNRALDTARTGKQAPANPSLFSRIKKHLGFNESVMLEAKRNKEEKERDEIESREALEKSLAHLRKVTKSFSHILKQPNHNSGK